jgi:hypothetical protein
MSRGGVGTARLLLNRCALHHSHQSDGCAGFESSTGQDRSDFVSLGTFRAIDSIASAHFAAFIQMELRVCTGIAPAESDKLLLRKRGNFFACRRRNFSYPPICLA